MRKFSRNGFTIIELIFALAITSIMLAVAIPRYNSYARQQDFNGNLQKLQACWQRAQQEAKAPLNLINGVTPRYAAVYFSVPATNSLTCTPQYYPLGTSLSSILNDTAVLLAPAPYSALTASDVRLLSTKINNDAAKVTNDPSFVKIVFGVLEGGIPVGIRSCDVASICNSQDMTGTMEKGVAFEMTVTETTNTVTQTIAMPALGVPIQQRIQ